MTFVTSGIVRKSGSGSCDCEGHSRKSESKETETLIMNRKNRRVQPSLWKKALNVCIVVLAALAAGILLTGCSMIERISYEWSDSGVKKWEEEAVASGVTASVEEYYYERLPEKLKEAYRELYVKLMRGESSGDFLSPVNVEEFWKVYYGVLADHPEIFWLGPNAQVEKSALTGTVVRYELETIVPLESRASMLEQIEAAADACIDLIWSEASDYQKIQFVYEYIIDTTTYDEGSPDSQNIQSALLHHSSVCAGYSKAFQYILNRMGMFCTYITGTIKDGGDHGWNMVRIDGSYYYVDVTWGDPVFANQVEGDSSTVINYNYLCCTQMDLFKTHTPDGSVELPECTSDNYNYYKLNGFYYESFDYNTVYHALMNSVWAGESSIVMKFGSREAFDGATYELFQGNLLSDAGQYLMELNGVSSWNYRYHTDENFYLVTIYWG